MNSIDKRLARLQVKAAMEREQQEAERIARLKQQEEELQTRYAQKLQRRKNGWDRHWRKCRRMGWPLPDLSTRPC